MGYFMVTASFGWEKAVRGPRPWVFFATRGRYRAPHISNLLVVFAGIDRYGPNRQACQVSRRKRNTGANAAAKGVYFEVYVLL